MAGLLLYETDNFLAVPHGKRSSGFAFYFKTFSLLPPSTLVLWKHLKNITSCLTCLNCFQCDKLKLNWKNICEENNI